MYKTALHWINENQYDAWILDNQATLESFREKLGDRLKEDEGHKIEILKPKFLFKKDGSNEALADHPANQYIFLQNAFDFYNEKIFITENNQPLPPCMITLEKKNRTYGHYLKNGFRLRDGDEAIDQININPLELDRDPKVFLSTLVHEMCHMWQSHYGNPPKAAYHNREWANMMLQCGLIPSDTGQKDGKQTGPKMSHYIEDNGLFDTLTSSLIQDGFTLPWKATRFAQNKVVNTRQKYQCPECGTKITAKKDLTLFCQGVDGGNHKTASMVRID